MVKVWDLIKIRRIWACILWVTWDIPKSSAPQAHSIWKIFCSRANTVPSPRFLTMGMQLVSTRMSKSLKMVLWLAGSIRSIKIPNAANISKITPSTSISTKSASENLIVQSLSKKWVVTKANTGPLKSSLKARDSVRTKESVFMVTHSFSCNTPVNKIRRSRKSLTTSLLRQQP